MQKFVKGDLVRVAKNMGSGMSHFDSDCDAIVMHSYKDKYGGGKSRMKIYCLYIKGRGEVSWYYENQLTLIEHNRLDLLKEWEDEQDAEDKEKADIDWIFTHGKEVLKSAHGATLRTLAANLGIDDLWGTGGEGFNYYANAMQILSIAKPFLEKNDKEGWIYFAKKVRDSIGQEN